MNEKNTLMQNIIGTVIGCLIAAVIGVPMLFYINKVETERSNQYIEQLRKEAHKDDAIMELSELKGKVEEIQSINRSSACTPEMEERLIEELDEIMEYEDTTKNEYLIDFKIIVEPGSIDCICEQILSQIQEKIYDIT